MRVQNQKCKGISLVDSKRGVVLGGLLAMGALTLATGSVAGIGNYVGKDVGTQNTGNQDDQVGVAKANQKDVQKDSFQKDSFQKDSFQKDGFKSGQRGRYRVEENSGSSDGVSKPAGTSGPETDAESRSQGPVRLARFAYVHGSVQWRADESMEWSNASVNTPLRQAAQVWVMEGGRAEIQFDDGSVLRLGNGALITLKALYSDGDGEFTQITVNEGLATLRSRNSASVYQVDMPLLSAKLKGNSQARFGVAEGTEIAVQKGEVQTEARHSNRVLHANDYLVLDDANSPIEVHAVPDADNWDTWNNERNRVIDQPSPSREHLPTNIGVVADDLDQYGKWRDDSKYGWVWVPGNQTGDWRPYNDGNWVWVEPFGWTWVGNEPWGWAPYHYGTWVSATYGWAWCPGPAIQYWSPAVVNFSLCEGNVAWAPLCPWEVRYPSAFEVGYFGRHWGFGFSIGCAGVYYPSDGGYCLGRRFHNGYVNHHTSLAHIMNVNNTNINGTNIHGLGNKGSNGFVPFNASHAQGASIARSDAFGGTGRYHRLPSSDASVFSRGQSVVPGSGRELVAGPASIVPTRQSLTSTRTFSGVSTPTGLVRTAFQGSLPTPVQRSVRAQGVPITAHSDAAARTGGGVVRDARGGTTPGNERPSLSARSGLGRNGNQPDTAASAARQARASLGIDTSSGGYRGAGIGTGSASTADRRYSGGNYSGSNYTGSRYSGGSNSGRSSTGSTYYGGGSVRTAPGSGSTGGNFSGGYRYSGGSVGGSSAGSIHSSGGSTGSAGHTGGGSGGRTGGGSAGGGRGR